MRDNEYYEGNYMNVQCKGIIKEENLKKVSKLKLYKIVFTTELRVFASDENEAYKIYRDFDDVNGGLIPKYEIKEIGNTLK